MADSLHGQSEHRVLAPSVGRRKLSGQAALAVNGDGWGRLSNEWGYFGMGPKNPDVFVDSDEYRTLGEAFWL